MKTKPSLLLLLFLALAHVAAYSQSTNALRAGLLNPACGCSGRVRVEIGQAALLPLTIALSHKDGANRVFHGVTGALEVEGLCPGLWKVSASPEKAADCTPVETEIQVPEVQLLLKTLEIQNPTGAGQADGRIVAQAVAVDSNGMEYTQGLHFTYQWSNGSTGNALTGAGAGAYTLTATNPETGCVVRKEFTLRVCGPDPEPFEVVINGGIGSAKDGPLIPLSVLFRSNPQEPFGPLPAEYIVEWSYGAHRAYGPETGVPVELAPIEVVVQITGPCGGQQTLRKRIISCENAAEELKNYMIARITEPCFGHNDGSVILEFTGTKGDDIRLTLNDRVIFDSSTREGMEAAGANWRAIVPSLRGGRTYTVSGYLGYHCPVTFSFLLPEKEPEKICTGYDSKTNMCIYNEACNGNLIGPPDNFRSPAFTVVDETTVRGAFSEGGLFPRCRKDLFCLCNGKAEKKENGKEAWETVRIGEYWEILESHGANTGIDWLSSSPAARKDPCGTIRYCTLDPSVYWGTFNFAQREKQNSRQVVTKEGKKCIQFTCTTVGLFRSRFTACVTNIPPPAQPPTQVIGFRICNYQSFNLLQMLIWHKNGALARRWPGPEAHLKYQGSRLENYLKGFTRLTDKKLRCAQITFCINDLNGYITSDADNNLCGAAVDIPGQSTQQSCEIASMQFDGEWFGSDFNQQLREQFFQTSQTFVEYAVFYCNNSSKYIRVEYGSSMFPAALLPDAQAQEDQPARFQPASAIPDEQRLHTFLEDPIEGEEQRLEVRISDAYDHERLLRFGKLTFENLSIPKAVIATDSLHLSGDFVFGNQVLTKTPAHHLLFQVSNWDTRTDALMEEKDPNSAYGFLYADTLMEYHGLLASQSFLQPHHLSIQDTGLSVAGMFKGDLYLDSALIAYSGHLSAFYLKVSRQGLLQDIQIVEKVDTLQGIRFSESRQGKIAFAAGYDQGALTVNGQTATMPFPKGIVIVTLGQDQAQILQKIDGAHPLTVKGISYDPDAAQIGLLLYGADSLRQSGSGITGPASNHISILSLSAEGVLKWTAGVPAAHLDLAQMALCDGSGNGIFAGFTYRDSLRIGTRLLKSKGEEDIAIVKFSNSGEIVQLDTIGTSGGETVSQMMHSDYVLFFGGALSGPEKNRTLGVMDYYNETDFNNRVYISAVLDTLGLDLQPSTSDTIIESALSETPLSALAQKEKPLQVSVPLFVFPNPFQEELTLQFHALEAATWEIRLLDNLGSVVRKQTQQVEQGFNQTKFSTAAVAPGMYFLQCISPGGYVLQSVKVVKVK